VATLRLTLTDDAGRTLADNRGGKPLIVEFGDGALITGLESALVGARVGERLRGALPPEDAYGALERRPQRIARERLPAVSPGDRLQAGVGHDFFSFWVHAVSDDAVYLDQWHPLSGRRLRYDVLIEKIQRAPAAATLQSSAPGVQKIAILRGVNIARVAALAPTRLVISARGELAALDTADGVVIWQRGPVSAYLDAVIAPNGALYALAPTRHPPRAPLDAIETFHPAPAAPPPLRGEAGLSSLLELRVIDGGTERTLWEGRHWVSMGWQAPSLLLADRHGRVLAWTPGAPEEPHLLHTFPEPVRIAHADDRLVAFETLGHPEDEERTVWFLRAGENRPRVLSPAGSQTITAIDADAQGRTLIRWSDLYSQRIAIDLADGQLLHDFGTTYCPPLALRWLSGGRVLVPHNESTFAVEVRAGLNGATIARCILDRFFWGLLVLADDQEILVVFPDGLERWSLHTGSMLHRYQLDTSHENVHLLGDVHELPDGRVLVSSNEGVYLLDR